MTSAPDPISAILRVWATETHLAPSGDAWVQTPPLPGLDPEYPGSRIGFRWSPPDLPGQPPAISEIAVLHGDRRRELPHDPRELLDLLRQEAGQRAMTEPPAIDVEAIQRADMGLLESMGARLKGPSATTYTTPAHQIGDGGTAGHVPGSWAIVESTFFPTLPGTGERPGQLWAPTVPWGGPPDTYPTIPLKDLDYSEYVRHGLSDYSIRHAEPEDAALVSAWMRRPHLVSSFRQAWPESRWRRELMALRERGDTDPLLLLHQGLPIGYIEVYRPALMAIGASRPTSPLTVGIHIALAETTYIKSGLGRMLLILFGDAVLEHSDRSRYSHALGEPDIRNPAMLGAARKTVAMQAGVLAFPHKCAVLFSNAHMAS